MHDIGKVIAIIVSLLLDVFTSSFEIVLSLFACTTDISNTFVSILLDLRGHNNAYAEKNAFFCFSKLDPKWVLLVQKWIFLQKFK